MAALDFFQKGLKKYLFGPFLILFLANGQALGQVYSKISLDISSHTCLLSTATQNGIGLTSDKGGNNSYSIKLGYRFGWKRLPFILRLGGARRDYGFKENESTIPYFVGAGDLQLRKHIYRGLFLYSYAGSEYGSAIPRQYKYRSPVTTAHNFELHQNYAWTFIRGFGIGFYLFDYGLGVSGFLERVSQLDSNDLPYTKTIGGIFWGLELKFRFKKDFLK